MPTRIGKRSDVIRGKNQQSTKDPGNDHVWMPKSHEARERVPTNLDIHTCCLREL